MTRANVLVLGLGVALAIAAGGSVYLAVQLAGQPAAAPVEVATVVAAAADIPAGTTFDATNTANLVRVARVPADQVEQQVLTSPLALLGRTTVAAVHSGEILQERQLRPAANAPAATEGLAVRLEPGYVAMALPMNDAIGVAGAVRPMDRVDLIASVPTRNASGAQTVLTQAIVRDARVLAVGGQSNPGQAARPAPSTLTLELTPQDALVVEHLVQAKVRVVLALRRPDDPPALITQPVSMDDIVRRLSATAPGPTPTPLPQATP